MLITSTENPCRLPNELQVPVLVRRNPQIVNATCLFFSAAAHPFFTTVPRAGATVPIAVGETSQPAGERREIKPDLTGELRNFNNVDRDQRCENFQSLLTRSSSGLNFPTDELQLSSAELK